MNKYIPVIGLEIHVELSTASKMFCGCSADWFGKEPNTHTCPVCLGLPGAIPVANRKAIEDAIQIANALGCKINKTSKFDRKHYFYPDLPKAFQISQYDEPFGQNGSYSIINPKIKSAPIRIRRVHMEEDTGKLIHKGSDTLIDFNRSGVPLVEIVTEPDFSDSETVKAFLEELQLLVRSLGVTDANMEEGSMRLEPNISLMSLRGAEGDAAILSGSLRFARDDFSKLPNYKVEVKNINSFKFAKNAIEYEIKRQAEILDKGETPKQETRGYNEAKGSTVSQRSKEEAHDYRYFPEPDIPPIIFTDDELKHILSTAKITPAVLYNKFVEQHKIEPHNSFVLLMNSKKSELFQRIIDNSEIKMLGPASKIAAMIINNKININNSFKEIENEIIDYLSVKKTDETALNSAIERVIEGNHKAVSEYKEGKETVLMFLVGQVMREMKGSASAGLVIEKLREYLSN